MTRIDKMSTHAYVQWNSELCLQLVCAAQPLIKAGMDFADALAELQDKYLPEYRHKKPGELARATHSEAMKGAFEAYRRLAPAAREEVVERLKDRRAAETRPTHGKLIRYTELEWSLLRRRVSYWKTTLGDRRTLARLVYEAQRVELPPDRWRTQESLQVHVSKAAPKSLADFMGKPIPPGLLNAHPFNPAQRHFTLAPEILAQAAPPPAAPPEPPPPPAPLVTAPALSPPPAPAEPARSLREMVASAPGVRPLLDRTEPPPVRLQVIQAATPPTQLERVPVDPMRAAMEQMFSGVSGLADAVAMHAVGVLEDRVRQIAEQLVTRAMDRIDQRMQALVKASLEKELGGGIEVPEVELAPMADMIGEGLERPVIKMDVVGLFGAQISEVKRALNGHADTVRFVDINQLKDWKPRAVVIVNSKIPSKVVDDRCRNAHAHVEKVWGSAQAVLKAIHQLYEQQGIPLAH